MSGTVGILNVGAGDTKLVFDRDNPAECIRAARIVKDMLRRGYALLVDSGRRDANDRPIYSRAYDFDETKAEYIIADYDPQVAEEGTDDEPAAEQAAAPGAAAPSPKKAARGRKRVHAADVNVVAVARSAGG